ncbi:hypothetical protein BGX21_006485 [Mortierella sp. AD011]|nr:hypothetical protein BGX21_006485 [Mortierella sp. AD011]
MVAACLGAQEGLDIEGSVSKQPSGKKLDLIARDTTNNRGWLLVENMRDWDETSTKFLHKSEVVLLKELHLIARHRNQETKLDDFKNKARFFSIYSGGRGIKGCMKETISQYVEALVQSNSDENTDVGDDGWIYKPNHHATHDETLGCDPIRPNDNYDDLDYDEYSRSEQDDELGEVATGKERYDFDYFPKPAGTRHGALGESNVMIKVKKSEAKHRKGETEVEAKVTLIPEDQADGEPEAVPECPDLSHTIAPLEIIGGPSMVQSGHSLLSPFQDDNTDNVSDKGQSVAAEDVNSTQDALKEFGSGIIKSSNIKFNEPWHTLAISTISLQSP